jgi:hypothetical protein
MAFRVEEEGGLRGSPSGGNGEGGSRDRIGESRRCDSVVGPTRTKYIKLNKNG